MQVIQIKNDFERNYAATFQNGNNAAEEIDNTGAQ